MNERERYLETILFGKPDRIPLQPGWPRESTLKRWRSEGINLKPDEPFSYNIMYKELGILPQPSYDKISPEVSFRMIPEFEEKVLEHCNGHYIVQDWMGNITEISDEFDVTYIREARDFVTRKWHRFPVENRDDFEAMKERYHPDSPGRFPPDFSERCKRLFQRDYPLHIGFAGPFWQLREWVGFEPLCMMFIEDPEFIEEMIGFWKEFILKVLEKLFREVVPDGIHISEDMAYKGKAMISPDMTRRFLLPVYKEWNNLIRSKGCPVFDMDSDGYIGELIPIWIEGGINCCNPIEVAAYNDIVQYRRIYGKQMAYSGGIDKRAIAKGGKVIDEEVIRVLPPLIKEGGFIPGCDHGVPNDISWQDYLYYSRLLANLTGWL